MNRRLWILVIVLAALLPFVGGALGLYSWVGPLSGDNITWILAVSTPVIVACLLVTGLVGILRDTKMISAKVTFAALLLNYLACFFAARWLLIQSNF